MPIKYETPQTSENPNAVKKAPKFVKGFPRTHPINNEANSQKLLEYMEDRLNFGNSARDVFVQQLEEIDKEIAGWLRPSPEDRARERKNRREGAITPTNVNLQLAYTQLDEELTFLMTVFAPDSGMFEAIASKDQVDIANGFLLLMNKHAEYYKYYREFQRILFDGLKWNICGGIIEWSKTHGTKLTSEAGGMLQRKENQVLYQGNCIKHIDWYNFIWDISVSPIDLHFKGEFFATIEVETPFRVKQMEANGEIFGALRFFNPDGTHQFTDAKYYKSHPELRFLPDAGATTAGNNYNWVSILSQGRGSSVGKGIEMVHYFGWLNPTHFGLSTAKEDDKMQIWRISFFPQKGICAAEHLSNAHGMLPIGCGMPIENSQELQQKSYGEILLPLQRFGSFILNTHMGATRKNIWGLVIYDPTRVNLAEVENEPAARIACSPAAYGQDLNQAVVDLAQRLPTDGAMNDLKSVIELMQYLLPTDTLRQVADLERATQYQAAAVVQGTNRRSHKIAKLLNDQMFSPMRHMMVYNIMEFQDSVTLLDQNGKPVQVDPSKFRNEGIEFTIGDGLKGLDRLSQNAILKDMINSIIQSQAALQEFDLPALLTYYTSSSGEKIDLRQFRRQPPAAQPPAGPQGTQAQPPVAQAAQAAE